MSDNLAKKYIIFRLIEFVFKTKKIEIMIF